MRKFILALALVAAVSGSSASSEPFRAGVARITVPDTQPLDTLIWYPTAADEIGWQQGSFPIAASLDAPLAAPVRLPIVLFSHGGGANCGSPLVHRDLLAELARQGFVVIAPLHCGRLGPRPAQVRKALDAVLADQRFSAHIDPARIGMVGFSLGTAVTLVLAGAVPNFAHLSMYCRDHSDDVKACNGVPTTGSADTAPPRKLADPLR